MEIHAETGNTQKASKTRTVEPTSIHGRLVRKITKSTFISNGGINLRTFESKLTFPLKIRTNAWIRKRYVKGKNPRHRQKSSWKHKRWKMKMPRKSAENVESGARLLIKAKIQYLFRVSWDAPLRLLSSHSSVLMLNFQNFYITKGPTTSAEKYPASTKSESQPVRAEGRRARSQPSADTPDRGTLRF